MTVAQLSDRLQDIAHSGSAQKEVKNVVDILVQPDGVYIVCGSNIEDIAENPPGVYQC